jgi:carbonic anhydrase
LRTLSQLFQQNRAWAAEMLRREAGFFEALSRQQSPR